MSSFSIRLPGGESAPSEYFKQLPPQARSFLRIGFDVLNRVFPQHADVLTGIPVETLVSRSVPDAETLASKLNISKSDTLALIGVVSFLAVVSSSSPKEFEPVSKTSAALVEAKLIEASATRAVETLLTHFGGERERVGGAFRRAEVAARLLPSLDAVDLEIDMRVDFEKGQVALAVPVVLVHIDTDAVHEEIWFQMSKVQAQKLLEDLKEALERVESAEKWAQGPR